MSFKNPHTFLFLPGYWLGEGKVTFSTSSEHIRFYTRWVVEPEQDGMIIANQQVEMQGNEEVLSNRYVLSNITSQKCLITIDNELVTSNQGQCVYDAKTIAWEFRGYETMEGYEGYTLEENGDYMFHAEYSSHDQFRTVIDGRIWLRQK